MPALYRRLAALQGTTAMPDAPPQADPLALRALLRTPAYAGLPDDAAAAMASQPARTPRPDPVTLKTLAGVWGLDRAKQFYGDLRRVLGTPGHPAADDADAIRALLAGTGFDAAHPDVRQAVDTLAAARLCTKDEADAVLHLLTYPAGGPATADEVAAQRAAIAREVEADGHVARVRRYLDDVLLAARADAAIPLVTPEAYFGGEG